MLDFLYLCQRNVEVWLSKGRFIAICFYPTVFGVNGFYFGFHIAFTSRSSFDCDLFI